MLLLKPLTDETFEVKKKYWEGIPVKGFCQLIPGAESLNKELIIKILL